jgi:two-component system sensor histidine kinase YesM
MGHIIIKGWVNDGKVWIEITDDGIGMTPEQLHKILTEEPDNYKDKSFGLKSTNERIQLYFGLQYGLEIDSVPGQGTTVRIMLPANMNWSDGK